MRVARARTPTAAARTSRSAFGGRTTTTRVVVTTNPPCTCVLHAFVCNHRTPTGQQLQPRGPGGPQPEGAPRSAPTRMPPSPARVADPSAPHADHPRLRSRRSAARCTTSPHLRTRITPACRIAIRPARTAERARTANTPDRAAQRTGTRTDRTLRLGPRHGETHDLVHPARPPAVRGRAPRPGRRAGEPASPRDQQPQRRAAGAQPERHAPARRRHRRRPRPARRERLPGRQVLRPKRPRRLPAGQRLRRQAPRPRAPRRRTADRLRARRHVLARSLRQRLLRPPLDQGRRCVGRRPPDAQPARLRRLQRQFHRPGQSIACQARAAAMLVGLDRAGRLDTVFDPQKWADTLGPPGPRAPAARGQDAGDRGGAGTHGGTRTEPRRAPSGRRGPRAGVRQPRLLRPRPGRRQARRGPPSPRRRRDAGDLGRGARRRHAGIAVGRPQQRPLRRVPRRLEPLRKVRRLPPERADAGRGPATPGRRLPTGRVPRHPHDDGHRREGRRSPSRRSTRSRAPRSPATESSTTSPPSPAARRSPAGWPAPSRRPA